MNEPDVLIIGAGPAGLSAAITLAQLGLSALLVEQRDQVGGAIYRGPSDRGNRTIMLSAQHSRHRHALLQGLTEAGSRIQCRMQSIFIGTDRDGRFLIDNRLAHRVQGIRPKAVILAVGTVEQVSPREGWELPGVTTVGGLQVQLKETGCPPRGSILLAGNGPLLLALAAQLALAGNAPVAVLERGRPFYAGLRHVPALWNALGNRANLLDAMSYTSVMLRERVPYHCGWSVVSIRSASTGLVAGCQHQNGRFREFLVQHLALHDGLTVNNTGLPQPQQSPQSCVLHAGDCREVLGANAASADGRRAARQVAHHLGQSMPSQLDQQLTQQLAQARQSQNALKKLFAAPPVEPTANAVICRCEGLRRADFDQLPVARSARELRLVGRFGMGNCQGRFCAESISRLAADKGIDFDPGMLNGQVPRWPLRPVALTSMASFFDDTPFHQPTASVCQNEGDRP